MLLEGHEASVTAIQVDTLKVVSGGADCKVILWSRATGVKLRILHGHQRSVLCLDIGPTWIVSGGQESEARIWHLPDEADPSQVMGNDKKTKLALDALKRNRDIKTRKKLASGDGFELEAGPGLTVAKFGALELIGGLADGHVDAHGVVDCARFDLACHAVERIDQRRHHVNGSLEFRAASHAFIFIHQPLFPHILLCEQTQ